MCFENCIEQLNEFRARKKPFTVWKLGNFDKKTGSLYTDYNGHRTEWLPNTIVKPHKIRKPLRSDDAATAGLYFYTAFDSVANDDDDNDRYENCWNQKIDVLITAQVNPKDVIAADYDDGDVICCTEAKVLKAFVMDPKLFRTTMLEHGITECKECIQEKNQELGAWEILRQCWEEEGRDEHEQYLQQMIEELALLTA